MQFPYRITAFDVFCADNTTLDSGSGGDTIRTEDRTTYKTPVSLLDVGGTASEILVTDGTQGMPTEGVAAHDAAAVGNPVLLGAQLDDAATDSVDEGDVGTLRISANRNLMVTVRDAAGNERGLNVDASGNIGVTDASGALTVDNGGTFAVQESGGALTSLQLIDDTVYTDGTGTPSKAIGVAGTDGTNPQIIKTDSAGELQVDVVTSALPSGAATLAEQQTQTASLSVLDDWDETDRAKVNIVAGQAGITAGAGAVGASTPRVTLASDDPGVALLGTIDADTGNIATSVGVMDDWDNAASDGASVSGDVAHDGIDAGEPVKIGAKAIAYGSNPTAVAAADRTDLYANRHGVLMVLGGVPGVITKEWTFTDSDGAQTDAALVTVSAGTKIAVTNIAAICDNANTGDVAVRVGFAAASLSAAATTGIAGIVMSHPGIAAGSGYNRGDGSGVLGVGADGEDLRITCEDPAGGSVRIVASYFEIAS